jgi:dTDP-4-dehydrorhamnose 3,5-epimerase
MIFKETVLKGAFLVEPEIRKDDRGYFYRFYCKQEFAQAGLDKNWVQFNHSFTSQLGTIRGMHYQLPPFAETKFLRCIAGKVYDVIIDLRQDSATFLQWFGTELSAENRNMLYIPEGFAHGFQALTSDCELVYHHSEYYTQGSEGGIKFNDPAININWPLHVTQLSERDHNHPFLADTFRGIKI